MIEKESLHAENVVVLVMELAGKLHDTLHELENVTRAREVEETGKRNEQEAGKKREGEAKLERDAERREKERRRAVEFENERKEKLDGERRREEEEEASKQSSWEQEREREREREGERASANERERERMLAGMMGLITTHARVYLRNVAFDVWLQCADRQKEERGQVPNEIGKEIGKY